MKHIKKRLFYDIETSFCQGTFWRPGWKQTITPAQILKHAKIICISWKWENEDEIHNLHWGLNKQCDKILIKKFVSILNKADEIVAHNGNRFDIKWIRARAAFHNLDMRPHYRMLDTYKIAKHLFALPSYKLSEVAKYFGLTAKLDPGGLQTWIDIIVNKDQEALDKMILYCNGDITTLEEVYAKIRRYSKVGTNYSVLTGGEKFMCPECGGPASWNKTYTTAAGTIKHYMRCKERTCFQSFDVNNKTYQDYLSHKMINGSN
jgi:hypothetical protein